MNSDQAAAAQRRRFPLKLEVIHTERITPHMQRVVFGGLAFDELARRHGGFTDSYVKLMFLRDGTDYPEPLDLDFVKESMQPEDRPVVRTYTIRWIDHEARRVAIDFVVHGDEGIAGPWAANAQPGDVLHLQGPGGAYSPAVDADWHLLAGDEAALPAIQSALESLPAASRAFVYLEVDGPEEEQKIETSAEIHLTWLHRNGAAAGTTTLIADAVKDLEWPQGRPHVFIHGEAGLLKALRAYVLTDHGVPRERASISGYWRRGNTEEGFRVWKSEQS